MFGKAGVQKIRDLAGMFYATGGPSKSQMEGLVDHAEAGEFHDFCLIVDAYQADDKLGGKRIEVACQLRGLAELFLKDPSRGNGGLELANALRYVNKLRNFNPKESCLLAC